MTGRSAAITAAALVFGMLTAAGCGSENPDYQSIWSSSTTAPASACTTIPTEDKPVAFPDYLQSINVTGEQVDPNTLTDLTASIPTPQGWGPYHNPNYTPGTVAIAKDNGYPMAILMVFKLTGQFDATEVVKHGNADAMLNENFNCLNDSLNNFRGFPSAMIEGSYDLQGKRLHSFNRIVIATGSPPAQQRYLVQLTVTSQADQAVAHAAATESVIAGFTVAAK